MTPPLDQAKRLGVHFVLALVTVASIAALAWIALDSWIMPHVARSGWQVVSVPDVTGLGAEQAVQKLVDAGLEPAIDPERKSAGKMGPDLVALQRPAAKDSVKSGHVVRIWLSAGATTVPVPDLVGQDSIEATTHVREAGLEIAAMAESDFRFAVPSISTALDCGLSGSMPWRIASSRP